MTWTQMVSDLALPSPSWTNADQDMHPGNRQCYMTWQGLRPGRLNSILGGCRPGQVSRSCFGNLLCKTPHSQAIQTHGWQQFRASYLLLQELFSEPQRRWAQTEAQRKKKKRRSPKNVQRAWAGSSSIHCSDMSQLHHWARLSSVSSDTLSLRALETGINNKNNNSLTTIAGKSVYEDMWVKVSLIPYPTLSSLGVMLARTLFLQQEYMYFGKWVFFFLLFLAPGLKVF